MVVLSVSLGFFQEHRSTKAADALRRMVQNNATVRRQDGGTGQGHATCRSGKVVPGDIVLLSAGDMIPSDVRLISAKDLFINQSTLTGEAMPLEKNRRRPRRQRRRHRSTSRTSASWAALSSAARRLRCCRTQPAPGQAYLARWRPRSPSSAC